MRLNCWKVQPKRKVKLDEATTAFVQRWQNMLMLEGTMPAQVATSVKFTRLIAELRQMWEDEEVHRAGILERRVRSRIAAPSSY